MRVTGTGLWRYAVSPYHGPRRLAGYGRTAGAARRYGSGTVTQQPMEPAGVHLF